MKGSENTPREGAPRASARIRRMPPVGRIASILMLSCAWIAMPRYASADESVRAKLAS